MLMIRSVHGLSKAILVCLIAATSGEVAAQSLQLEEIVVTARRREESIQDIPVAVTAFSAEELTRRGVTELEDVAMYTPGFVFEDFASSFSAAPVLRGLTQVNVSSEVQNVATFVDGVYIQRNYAVDISGADVQRIEIVKGPQSALYGQNAFAGAINYVLNRPDDELKALAEVTGGTDGRLDYRVAAGGPLIDDKLGLRGAYSKAEFDGTWRNSLPGLDGDSARTGQSESETYSLKAVFTPTEWLEVDATYLRVDRSVGIRPGYNINTGDVQNTGNCGPLNATTRNPIFICGELPVSPDRFYTSRSTRAPGLEVLYLPTAGFRNETEFLGADAIVRFDGGLGLSYHYGQVDARGQEISSNTINPLAPSFGTNLNALATGAVVLGFFNPAQKEGSTNDFESHELRFEYAPEGSPLTAMLGAYRSDFDDVYRFFLTSLPVGQPAVDTTSGYLDMTGFGFGLTDRVNTGKVTAGFGALSYRFGERLTLGGELRFSKEEKTVRDVRANITLADEFDDWIPRVSADYRLNDDVLLYLSMAKGLKTGGFNGVTAGTVTIPVEERAFGPESNWTYEVGAKSLLLDKRLVLNVALFQVDWSDMQIQALPSNTPAALVNNTPVIYRNLGDARSRGVEVESVFSLSDSWVFNLGFSVTDPTYKDGTLSFRFNGRCDDIVCPRSTAIGGKTLPRTAKTQATAGLQYSSRFSSEIDFFIRGDVVYQSEMQAEEMNLAQIPPRTLVNARAGLSRNNWELALWGKNIFDEEYVANSFFVVQGVGYGTAFGERAMAGATVTFRY
jgi:iron complex outermembrane receptor protein